MKKLNLLYCSFFAVLFMLSQFSIAATQNSLTKVIVSPSHKDWHYKLKEKASFEVRVFVDNIMIEDVEVKYAISEDMMPARKEGNVTLKKGVAKIDAGSMNKPGLLRCEVEVQIDGKPYKSMATVAYAPEQIKPTTTEPQDFTQFWTKALEDARQIPLDAKMTLLPEQCTSTVNVYHISFQNQRSGSRIYGMLAMPKAEGKYPAILMVPGAGVYKYGASTHWASQGFITLAIGIHGVPVNLDQQVYSDLTGGPLNGYWKANSDNKDNYYYKRVYLGCAKAIDFIYSLPEFDGNNLFTRGGSQGGALAITTAALDKRVKAVVSFYPALSDITGYAHGRAGGWPHFKSKEEITPEKLETTKYYDVVNFARHLTVPVFYAFGYNDLTCPPTTVYSVYNTITSPKELLLIRELGHTWIPEIDEKSFEWMKDQVK